MKTAAKNILKALSRIIANSLYVGMPAAVAYLLATSEIPDGITIIGLFIILLVPPFCVILALGFAYHSYESWRNNTWGWTVDDD